MAHQADSRDGTHSEIKDGEFHAPVVQAGHGNIFYFIRHGWRRVEVAVSMAVLTVLVVIAGLLVPRLLDDSESAADDSKSAPGKPIADADTSAWGCYESAVVPGLKVGPKGMDTVTSFPRGGVQASGSGITIVLQGSSDEELLLTGARAEIVSRHRPVRGTHVINPCGSDAPKRVFSVDLDQESPPLKAIPDPRPDAGARKFTNWPYAIKHGDAEYFEVRPRSTKYDTEFRIVISWSSGGHTDEMTLDDHGKPFRITADTAADRLCVGLRQGNYWLFPAGSPDCGGAN